MACYSNPPLLISVLDIPHQLQYRQEWCMVTGPQWLPHACTAAVNSPCHLHLACKRALCRQWKISSLFGEYDVFLKQYNRLGNSSPAVTGMPARLQCISSPAVAASQSSWSSSFSQLPFMISISTFYTYYSWHRTLKGLRGLKRDSRHDYSFVHDVHTLWD